MDDQNKNLILATVLSFLVILGWFVLGPMYFPQWFPTEPVVEQQVASEAAAPAATTTAVDPAEPLPEAARLTIDTPKLSGSVSALGGRLDDLSLKTYRETLAPDSPTVHLLSKVGETTPYYAVFGWAPGVGLEPADVPGAKTEWAIAAGSTLTPETPVTLTWDNTKGLHFTRTISVDSDFMFTVADAVENKGTADVSLYSYGIVARHGLPKLQNIYVVHEGLIRRADGAFGEVDYDEMVDLAPVEREAAPAEVIEATTDGWIGFTDHYWMTTLIPEQGKPYTSVAKYVASAGIYQAEIRQPLTTVAAGGKIETSLKLFAGAKEWGTIKGYQNEGGIAGFIDSIDWGWFYFLTKPIFAVLHWLNAQIGNMGVAIIGLTFFLKLLVLPLAYKSYVSMARMKELQPEMEALKERAGDDKQKMQKEMMQLYKDKKVNPAAGCLPILIQIPIFFALYKVIFVTLELRHAPFFGWLNDLSAPDSSSLYNLFGLLPWDGPAAGSITALIFIGILPILLGISMWLQQKLNPAPTDPVQQQIFAYMPWVFMFMLGSFASGLVVYWITNNTITFTQQYMIMRSHGHKPDLFGNIKSGFKKTPVPVAEKAEKEMMGVLAQICRHPIKGHGRETLASVGLLAGECLPWDRHWAVAHEAARLVPGWNPCQNFARGAKAAGLMAITSELDEATATVTLRHPDLGKLVFRPDDAADVARFLAWAQPLSPANRAQPMGIVSAGRGMTDSDFPSVSILNTASLADLAARMGLDLSPHRFRGNLWLDGAPAWAELDWIGRQIRIGDAVLEIKERITRCNATKVDPETGLPNADTLKALESAFGHQDFGVYAVVIEGGPLSTGCAWSLI